MPKLIKNGAISDNTWQLIDKPADATSTLVLPAGQIIVPLAVWKSQRQTLTFRRNEVGVWLDSDETADALGPDAQSLPLICVNFPTFVDGRGFTTARLLRDRFHFTGELRAIGYILRDQLFYLRRCGFNAFCLAEGADLETAITSLSDFSESYQTAADQPVPLFRRRA